MFAETRIGISLVLVTGLTACDPSPKKPEVIETAVVTQRVGDAPAAPEAIEGASAREERSVRLFGPGISRQRQTRI